MRSDNPPDIRAECQNRELAARQILLISDVLIGRYEQIKACSFGSP
jgi:hypothetical protein